MTKCIAVLFPLMLFAQGPIEIREVNGGRLAWRFLEDKKNAGQNAALWIANETQALRGVLFILHNGTEAYRSDAQEFCRRENFALYASLIRWDVYERELPAQLAELGAALGHPEAANVPWALMGGSRNVGALLELVRRDPARNQRYLCMLFNGGPGAGLRLDGTVAKGHTQSDAELFAGIPMLAVNGGADPFLSGMLWQTNVYPQIHAASFPYSVAADWDCGHDRQRAELLYFPFIREIHAKRVPADADFAKGPVDLKPFPFADGVVTAKVDWDNPRAGELSPAKSQPGGVWMPSAAFAAEWEKFHLRGEDAPTHDFVSARKAAHAAGLPRSMTGLDAAALVALDALQARRDADVPRDWKTVYSNDFSRADAPEWTNYYQPDPAQAPADKRHAADRLAVNEGGLEIESEVHAVAMLKYDWPDDVAVEFRVLPLREKTCDLSVILSGNRGGEAFPWRNGMIYQFGAHFNQGSFWAVLEQPHKEWQPHDDGARIRPGEWNTVRVERLGGVARAVVNGEARGERVVSPEAFSQFSGRRIGLYTFGGAARFDDVRVYVREAVNPEELPPMPSLEARAHLATQLLRAAESPYTERRDAAWRLLGDHLPDLNDVMIDRVLPEAIAQRLRQMTESLPR